MFSPLFFSGVCLTCTSLITLGWFNAMRHWISVVARSAAPIDAMMALLCMNFMATRSCVSWCVPSRTLNHQHTTSTE